MDETTTFLLTTLVVSLNSLIHKAKKIPADT